MSQSGSFVSIATSLLDAKDRFSLPATLRNRFFGGREDVKKICLRLDDERPVIEAFDELYVDAMQKELIELANGPEAGEKDGSLAGRFALADRIARYTSAVVPVSIDSAGRFTIPPRMLKYTRIKEAVIVEGGGRTMRIWAPEDYLEHGDLHRMVRDETEEFLAEVQARRVTGGEA